jgi:integrase
VAKKLRRQRESGALRQLPSGRWQPAVFEVGNTYTSLGTFRTRAEAEKVLTAAMADRHRGSWVDPRDGRVTFEAYSGRWLTERATLRPRTRELYEGLLRLHIVPFFGPTELGSVTPSMVRRWHAELTRADRPGPVTVAKCYRLLRTIFTTAAADDLIAKNPCVLVGAGVERSPERPVASIADVERLVATAPAHLKALILMATYTSLRLGELSALTRRNLDLDSGVVVVVASASDLRDGTRIIGEPKSTAGRRRVAIPEAISDAVREHLDTFAEPGADGLVFVGPKGGPLRRGNFSSTWRSIVRETGLEHLRFHDLRHTGNTLAATTGASTKELMVRMGHSSTRAALGYQHATEEREQRIASKLSEMISRVRADE